MSRALIAMSGGVDSAVAALFMQKAGYECIGVTMKLFRNEDAGICSEKTCCSADDAEDARRVCEILGMPHYVLNFTEGFKRQVMDRFSEAYQRGETPNPCIDCNRYMKFDRLFQKARELECEKLVTGHYARVEFDGSSERYMLKKALDSRKDQSYVLYSLTQEQLAHTEFPLGEVTKSEVRKIAAENGFKNAEKHESQDICFVPDGDYGSFIESYTGKSFPAGKFVGTNGEIYGEHRGIIRYTVGQRKGLGLSFAQPMYVVRIDPQTNAVVLGESGELFSRELCAQDINLIEREELSEPMRVKAKIRYRQPEQWAEARVSGDKLFVSFDEPQRAVTKGQAVVLYDGETVLGGGTISETGVDGGKNSFTFEGK